MKIENSNFTDIDHEIEAGAINSLLVFFKQEANLMLRNMINNILKQDNYNYFNSKFLYIMDKIKHLSLELEQIGYFTKE